jgi:putative mycofactocin binding protein MftB
MLPEQAMSLSGSVALRPEPFGALAYDFHTRRLSFLKSPQLVDVVRRLADEPTVADALSGAGVPATRWPSYLAALDTLATSGIIQERDQ